MANERHRRVAADARARGLGHLLAAERRVALGLRALGILALENLQANWAIANDSPARACLDVCIAELDGHVGFELLEEATGVDRAQRARQRRLAVRDVTDRANILQAR